jgi:hypothetical protein
MAMLALCAFIADTARVLSQEPHTSALYRI